MEASDEEFDTEEVRKLVKRLDELDPIPLPWKSDEEALKDFWDYCEERQREERIIAEISNKTVYARCLSIFTEYVLSR